MKIVKYIIGLLLVPIGAFVVLFNYTSLPHPNIHDILSREVLLGITGAIAVILGLFLLRKPKNLFYNTNKSWDVWLSLLYYIGTAMLIVAIYMMCNLVLLFSGPIYSP